MDEPEPADGDETYLQLYDYRLQVQQLYRRRNEALAAGEPPEAVHRRFREMRDRLFASHPQSALDEEQQRSFEGLPYFPYNPEAVVEAVLDPNVAPRVMTVQTSQEEEMRLALAAVVSFRFQGTEAALSLYWIDVYGGGLFLPFRDATAPAETYGGGRYLVDTVKGSDFCEPAEEGSGAQRRVVLDFNYAYNPSCAYNYRWSCPLAPRENHLSFPIRAGEMRPG